MAQQAAAGDGAKLGFLKIARAFTTDDGKIYIKFPNEFSMSMVDNTVMRDNIRAAINMIGKRNISDSDLILCVLEGNEKISDLDEFEI